MTEEQKHSNEAAAFAASLGALEGSIKKVDSWEERAEAQEVRAQELQKSAIAANASITAANESSTRYREIDAARSERYEQEHLRAWNQDAERHAVYLAEIKHVQAHREREAAAFESIAESLKAIAGKADK